MKQIITTSISGDLLADHEKSAEHRIKIEYGPLKVNTAVRR